VPGLACPQPTVIQLLLWGIKTDAQHYYNTGPRQKEMTYNWSVCCLGTARNHDNRYIAELYAMNNEQ
jgi:hypothetical protein